MEPRGPQKDIKSRRPAGGIGSTGHDDSLLSEHINSNIRSVEAKQVTGTTGTEIVNSQYMKSQTH